MLKKYRKWRERQRCKRCRYSAVCLSSTPLLTAAHLYLRNYVNPPPNCPGMDELREYTKERSKNTGWPQDHRSDNAITVVAKHLVYRTTPSDEPMASTRRSMAEFWRKGGRF